jgi:hypothetical protein
MGRPLIVGAIVFALAALGLETLWTVRARSASLGPLIGQPVAFYHSVHAGELKIDCLYCHPKAETAPVATLPSLELCMTCHRYISPTHPEIAKGRAHWDEGKPVRWRRVTRLPDHVRFVHHMHLAGDIQCKDRHGDLTKVKVLPQRRFCMGWCLDLHRKKDASTDCGTCHY